MNRSPFRRIDLVLVSASLLVSAMNSGAQTPANWLGGSANWNTPANWSGGVIPNNGVPPGSTYDAFINVAGTYTVTMNTPITLTNLSLGNASATLQVSNTSLTLANSAILNAGIIQLSSATVAGGTINSAGGRVAPNFITSSLSGVSLGLNVLDMSGGRIALTNGSNFTGGPGTITLGSSSQIFIAEAATIASGAIFALGSSASLSADGGFTVTLDAATTDTVTINVLGTNAALGGGFQSSTPNSILVNKGQVQFGAATVGGSVNIASAGAGSLFRNEGKLVASSSGAANSINLAGGSYTNAGTIEAATGGVINLNGTFTRQDLGTFTNTGGTINLNGTLNNTSLVLDNTTGSIDLVGGTIVGGTVSAAGTARLRPNFITSTLNGVSLGLNVLDMSAGRVQLINGTTFTGGPGTITLGGSSQIFIAQSATIASGTNFALGSNASLSADGGFMVTLDAATTNTVTINVLGTNAALGGGFQSSTPNSILINKGQGQFGPATVGGSLTIASQGTGSRFRNEGQLVAGSTGAANTINLTGGSYLNAGSIVAATGGVINLNGTFTRQDLGTFTNTGGTINLNGTLNNTVLDLDNTTGTLNMVAGTIVGGTVSAAGTARLKPGFSTSTLNGVSLGVNALDMSAGRIALTNGTNFTGGPGTITLGANSQVFIAQAVTIASGTMFALASSASVSADGGFTATLDAATADTVTINVLGTNAVLGGGFQSSTPNSILINKGRVQFGPASVGGSVSIAALGAGSRFRNEGQVVAGSSGTANTINMSSFTNAGTLIAATGGIINLTGTFTRADLGTFTNTGGAINIGGTLNNTSLNLDNTTGPITLTGGTIVGGTVTAVGTGRLRADGQTSNILNGATLAFDVMDLTPVGSRIRLTGGTTLTGAGVISLGTGSAVYLSQSDPVPSGISFAMGPSSSLSAEGVTATLAASNPSILNARVAAGASVSIGGGILAGGANSILVNQGTIDFAGPGSTMAILSGGAGSRYQNDGILTVNTVGSNINFGGTTTFTNNGTLTASGGTVNVPASATFTNFNAGTLTGGTYQVFASSEINLNGRVITTVAANTTVLLSGASSVFTAANSVNTNNGSFTITNGRQHTVASFTNAGSLTVGTAAGDLARMVANVQVNTGGIVRGTGTIEGPVTVNFGGTLAPGTSPGILTVTGPVTLNPGATFSVELTGPTAGTGGYSQLNLAGSGTINLNNATFASTLSYAPAIADSFTIVTGGAVTGIFNGLPDGTLVDIGAFMGGAFKATIVYEATQVRLINPVPEPASILIACVGASLAAAGVRRWRRRRTV